MISLFGHSAIFKVQTPAVLVVASFMLGAPGATYPSGLEKPSNPVPLVSQPLVPGSVRPGSAGFTLTVNGSGFVPGAVVNWKNSPRATTYVSGTKLTATILSSDVVQKGTASITVSNPAPGGGTSNVAFLFIAAPRSFIGSLGGPTYSAGSIPFSAVAADFSGDGRLDLAVVNSGANTISVLVGKGDGTFQHETDYSTGVSPYGVVTGDFNSDGKPDLAVVNDGANSVSILLGNGDGTFRDHVDYATGAFPFAVATGDFNRDGKLDLAVVNSLDSTVSVLLGNGDGSFGVQQTFATGSGPTAVTVGDFNGDGKLDLATADYNSTAASVLFGNGDGTFQTNADYDLGDEADPTSIVNGDLNGDGKPDLVATSNPTHGLVVLLNNGDGTFQTAVTYTIGSASYPMSVCIGDFNADGKLDLATTDYGSGQVAILLGNGDGTFQTDVDTVTGGNPVALAVGDFNGDGALDLVTASYSLSTVSDLLQQTSRAPR